MSKPQDDDFARNLEDIIPSRHPLDAAVWDFNAVITGEQKGSP